MLTKVCGKGHGSHANKKALVGDDIYFSNITYARRTYVPDQPLPVHPQRLASPESHYGQQKVPPWWGSFERLLSSAVGYRGVPSVRLWIVPRKDDHND